MLWAQAAPVVIAGGDDGDQVSAEQLSASDRLILGYLNSGLPDRAIGRRLDVAERTIGRRIHRLMRAAGAETRFQLGSRATALGWLESTAPELLDLTVEPGEPTGATTT